MSREEIVDALKTLQDCCKAHSRCENCPLRNEPARCGVTSASPNKWRINGTEITIWKALK